MTGVLLTALESGLIFSILAIGVVITFKVLAVSDLSVEGTFPLGAFLVGRFLTLGLNPFLSLGISLVGGALAGLATYVFHKKFKIEAILAGILTMTILYSVNLRLTGKSNIPLFNYPSIFVYFQNKLLILLVIVLLVKLLLDWFFNTEQGYLLVITGDNEDLVKSLGKNPDTYLMVGIMLSNALVALSGAIQAQYQGFIDITMGQSMIVTALASIVIGDAIFRESRKLKLSTRAIIGSISYRIIIGLAIELGLNPNDLKAVTAVIVLLFIGYNNIQSKQKEGKILRDLSIE
ncbi:MAG: ABC transporter permease [Tissierellia bacterium]|nr:ABC transporter permease [Tissierellia bacterium]